MAWCARSTRSSIPRRSRGAQVGKGEVGECRAVASVALSKLAMQARPGGSARPVRRGRLILWGAYGELQQSVPRRSGIRAAHADGPPCRVRALDGACIACVLSLAVNQTARGSLTNYLPALRARRSEEHTSELQSQSNLVCRL